MIIASARSSSPESVESRPPPYTRVAEGETNRKITFTIVNEDNEVVTLSAKRSSKALRILETACDVFKLDSSKCRLQHAGRVYGHGDIERLTLSSLDIENGDRLGISWDCTTIQSEMRLYPTEPSHTASLYNEGKVRISVTLAPQWRFDDLGPEAPVDKATGSSKIIWHADLRPDGSLAIPNLPGRFDRLSWESRSKPVITSERHLSEDSIPGNANRPLNVAVEDPSLQVNKHSPLRKHLGPDMWSSLLLHVICVIALSPMVVILDILSFLGLRRKRKGKKVDMDDQIRPTTQILNLLDPSKCLRDENSVLLRGTDVRRHLEGVLETTGVPRTVWDAFVGRICPSIARNQYVLMRLISTEDYRQMSTIRVSPEPDTLVRLLLVYAGVPSTNLGEWPGAARRGQASFSDQTEIFCKSVPMAKGGAGFTAVELSCVQLYLDEE
ncbi:hypothetical protein FRB90_011917 [Tulasnella sp. 427]|nr:hypothetical protein FRB90_011917 [Tulasnella sp. 427]